jgi:Ca2+-binding EF-hand superfamily protein
MKFNTLVPLVSVALLFAGASAYAQSESSTTSDRSSTTSVTTTTNASTERVAGTREDFDRMDTKNHGYLTSGDVKSDKWLKHNFARCNVKGNGRMSWDEYSNCHE